MNCIRGGPKSFEHYWDEAGKPSSKGYWRLLFFFSLGLIMNDIEKFGMALLREKGPHKVTT